MVIKKKLSSVSGSSMVEAAMVIPIIFIIIAIIISMTIRTNSNVGDSCAEYESEASEWHSKDPQATETTLRLRWVKGIS